MGVRAGAVRAGRSTSSTVLIVIASVALLLGVIDLWAADTLFDSRHFAGITAQAVQDPAVKSEITRLLVDQIVQVRPELLAVRPLIETVVQTVIGSSAFQRILVPAVDQLHETIFMTSPDIAAQIPPDIKAGLVQIGQRGVAPGFALHADGPGIELLVLLGVGVGLYAAAIALSRNRRGAVTSIGVSLALLALLLFLGLGIGRQFLTAQFKTESTARAVATLYDAFSADLIDWLWIIGIAGVVLAATASATIRAGDARQRLESIGRRLGRLPVSRWGQLIYAAAGVALSVLLIADPGLTISLVLRAIGLVVLYLCGTELLRLLGLRSAENATEAAPAGRVRALRQTVGVRLAAGAVLLAAVFIGGLVVRSAGGTIRGEGANIAAASGPMRCNGHEELCDRPLNQVAFAATHNSMSTQEKGWYFPSNARTIADQLKSGIRALLIDTHYGTQARRGVLTDFSRQTEQQRAAIEAQLGPDALQAAQRLQAAIGLPVAGAQSDVYLCHGFCELGATSLVKTLTDLRTFLKRQPNEVVILFFEDYASPQDTEAAFVGARLLSSVYVHDPGKPWPTLRELIETDHRVVVLSEKIGDQEKPAWYHDGFALVG